MPDSKNNEIIKKISKETGLSESSVYKILHDPFEFSVKTGDTVKRLAKEYGLTEETPSGKGRLADILVMIPSRPSYYWRKAVHGMRDAGRDAELRDGLRISLDFEYYATLFEQERIREMYEGFQDDEKPDYAGYIIYPVGDRSCTDFVSQKSKSRPVVIFNEAENKSLRFEGGAAENIAYISADHCREGREAFSLIEADGTGLHHIAAVVPSADKGENAAMLRARSFMAAAAAFDPDITVSSINIEVRSRITSAILAGKIYELSKTKPIDCIYVSSGVTYVACEAVLKLRQRFPEDFRDTFIIGHELSPADMKYLKAGLIKGCVAQDAYLQGYEAVRQICGYLLENKPLESKTFESCVIR